MLVDGMVLPGNWGMRSTCQITAFNRLVTCLASLTRVCVRLAFFAAAQLCCKSMMLSLQLHSDVARKYEDLALCL